MCWFKTKNPSVSIGYKTPDIEMRWNVQEVYKEATEPNEKAKLLKTEKTLQWRTPPSGSWIDVYSYWNVPIYIKD